MRILAIDQATSKVGVSLFVDDKLVDYGLYEFKGETSKRINQVNQLLMELIDEHTPNVVILEDIFKSGSIVAYRTLCELIGVLKNTLIDLDIPYYILPNKTWTSFLGVNGKREEQKDMVVKKMEQFYSIKLHNLNDVGDSIGIGHVAKILIKQGKLKISKEGE